jgi:hypothetical protein
MLLTPFSFVELFFNGFMQNSNENINFNLTREVNHGGLMFVSSGCGCSLAISGLAGKGYGMRRDIKK